MSENGRSTGSNSIHSFVLGGALVVLLLGMYLTTNGNHVFLQVGKEQIRLPETCILKSTTGIECAGCGLTRSTIQLLDGAIHRSVDTHPAGGLILLLILLQIPYRAFILWTGVEPASEPRATGWMMGSAIAVLLGIWLLSFGLPG